MSGNEWKWTGVAAAVVATITGITVALLTGAVSVGLFTIGMWIGLSGFGAVVSLVNLADARADLKYQIGKQERQWLRALVAKVNIANESMRVVAHTLLCLAGVLVAWVQFNPDPPPASLYVRGVILLTIAILVSQTLVHRWLRHRLTRPSSRALPPERVEATAPVRVEIVNVDPVDVAITDTKPQEGPPAS